MSTSQGFDFWQSTERLHCTGATLVLVLLATCCFNEVEAASLSKQTLFSAFGGLSRARMVPLCGSWDYLIAFPSKAQFSLCLWGHDNKFLSDCRQHESEIVSSGVVTSLTIPLFIACLFILFITNSFPRLCASSSFAHLLSVLVESHSSVSVLRESLQLLFFLDVSMHLHVIKQSGYPTIRTYLNFEVVLVL